jgi:3-oxoacyl-[acyl-carrier protein] reductase
MSEKVALVTGAGKGIGAACAIELGQAGYQVAIHYRSQPETARALSDSIPNSKTFQYDLTEDGACEALIKDVKTQMGRIDVLVNNAGMSTDQLITFAKPEEFDRLIATNLRPVFLLSKYASRLMIRQKFGRIINMTSVVGHTGNPGQSMYAASKSAITGLTKSMAAELGNFNILCNCVAPGFIETDMTGSLPEEVKQQILNKIPLGHLGTVKDVAAAVAFLASPQSSYITGSTIHVNGGMYTN